MNSPWNTSLSEIRHSHDNYIVYPADVYRTPTTHIVSSTYSYHTLTKVPSSVPLTQSSHHNQVDISIIPTVKKDSFVSFLSSLFFPAMLLSSIFYFLRASVTVSSQGPLDGPLSITRSGAKFQMLVYPLFFYLFKRLLFMFA